MSNASTVGMDIGKRVFYLCGMNDKGRVLYRKRMNRSEIVGFFSNHGKCLIGLEACAGAHYWGRELSKLGHEVKLMPPKYVKPYVKTNKNDTNDAEACAEAVTRPTMRFVAIKTEAQEELMQLHRTRERLIKNRTALGNQVRGFLLEYGITIPKSMSKLPERLRELLLSPTVELPPLIQEMVERGLLELQSIGQEISHYEDKLLAISKAHSVCKQLMTLPGVGPLTATAIVAAVSNISHFRNGRQFAAFLGLVPRQHSTGGKSKLGRISKRGDMYLRKLLVQGAHSVMRYASTKSCRMSRWIVSVSERRGACRCAVAVANKNARIIWAMLARGAEYQADYEPLRATA